MDEVLLQIQRGQRPHREQRRDSQKDSHCRPLNQHPPRQQPQQSQGYVPSYPGTTERHGYGQTAAIGRRSLPDEALHRANCGQQQEGRGGSVNDDSVQGRKTDGDERSHRVAYVGGFNGWCQEMADGEMLTASSKSSVSSDESQGSGGGGSSSLVSNRLEAIWEWNSTGEGDGYLPGGRKRKKTMEPVAERGIELQQLPKNWSRESTSLHDYLRIMDELKKLLLGDGVELESAGTCTREEIRKKEENIMRLLHLLKMASLERDEARDQLQELRNRMAVAQPCCPFEHPPSFSCLHSESASIELARCMSSITEFGGLSCADNYQLDSFSVVQPTPDLISATEHPNARGIADSSDQAMSQRHLLPERRSSMTTELFAGTAMSDRASVVIDSLIMKKPLPEKGKLLQAVIEAGPLLRTLLVAGPLPQWRNPPPPRPFQIPPVSVKGCESETLDQNATWSSIDNLVESSAKGFHFQNLLVASRVYAASSSASITRMPTISTCASSYKALIGKRQKI